MDGQNCGEVVKEEDQIQNIPETICSGGVGDLRHAPGSTCVDGAAGDGEGAPLQDISEALSHLAVCDGTVEKKDEKDDAGDEDERAGAPCIETDMEGVKLGNTPNEEVDRAVIFNDDEEPRAVTADMQAEGQNAVANLHLPFAVIERLSSFCSKEALASLRYVSKEWNSAVLKTWRNTAQIVVVDYHGEPRKEPFKRFVKLPDFMNRFTDENDTLQLNCPAYRFQSFKFETCYLTYNNPNMVAFWEKVGSFITRLELSNLRIEKMDTVLGVLFESIPNVQTLILDKIYVVKHAAQSERPGFFESCVPQMTLKALKVRSLAKFPMNWLMFLRHFPKIESLECVDTKTDVDLSHILLAISTIRTQSDITNVLQLKSLAIIRGDAK